MWVPADTSPGHRVRFAAFRPSLERCPDGGQAVTSLCLAEPRCLVTPELSAL